MQSSIEIAKRIAELKDFVRPFNKELRELDALHKGAEERETSAAYGLEASKLFMAVCKRFQFTIHTRLDEHYYDTRLHIKYNPDWLPGTTLVCGRLSTNMRSTMLRDFCGQCLVATEVDTQYEHVKEIEKMTGLTFSNQFIKQLSKRKSKIMSTESTINSQGAKLTLQTTPYFYVEARYEGTTQTTNFVVFTKDRRGAIDLANRYAMQISPGCHEVKDVMLDKNGMIETSTDLVKRGLYVIE